MPKLKITKHKHHIIPKHMGGSDDEDNLILLTIEEHASAHLELYKKYNKHEDYVAYLFLKGDEQAWVERSKLGGKRGGLAAGKIHKESGFTKKLGGIYGPIQGKINKENGHMKRISLSRTTEERKRIGKKSSETCRKKQVNSFFDPELRIKSAIKGGEIQGKNNAESGHLKNISNNYWKKVKSGEIIRKKRIWISSDELKLSKQILKNEELPNGFIKGRKY